MNSLMLAHLLLRCLIGPLHLALYVIAFCFIDHIAACFRLVLPCWHDALFVYLHLKVFVGRVWNGWMLWAHLIQCLQVLNWAIVWIQLSFWLSICNFLVWSQSVIFLWMQLRLHLGSRIICNLLWAYDDIVAIN